MAGEFDLQLDPTLDRMNDNLTIYKTALRRESNHSKELGQQLAAKSDEHARLTERLQEIEGLANQYAKELSEAKMIIASLEEMLREVESGAMPRQAPEPEAAAPVQAIPDNLVPLNGNLRVPVQHQP